MATEHLTKLEWLHNWIIFLATSVTKMLDHNNNTKIAMSI